MTGFYLMHRGWMDHPVFKAEPFTEREAWQWLIENAAWKDGRVRIKAFVVEVKRGQVAASLRYMAEKWQWQESRVRRFLGRLAKERMVECVADAGVNVITVCNYDDYQIASCVDDAPTDAAATQQRRSSDANKNEGNEETNSSDADASGAADATPVRPGDVKAEIFGTLLKALAKLSGKKPDALRPALGRLCSAYTDAVVFEALQVTIREGPVDPLGYLHALVNGKAQRPRYGKPQRTEQSDRNAILDGLADELEGGGPPAGHGHGSAAPILLAAYRG